LQTTATGLPWRVIWRGIPEDSTSRSASVQWVLNSLTERVLGGDEGAIMKDTVK
jgi:hypothetical protein